MVLGKIKRLRYFCLFNMYNLVLNLSGFIGLL